MDEQFEKEPELTLEESAAVVARALPSVVRKYVADGPYKVVVSRLMGKYQLTPEQGSLLEHHLLMVIVGIEEMAELLESLSTTGKLPKAKIAAIEVELDEQVFTPLNKFVKQPELFIPSAPATPKAAQPPQSKPKSVQVPLPSYASAPPPQSPSYMRTEPRVPETFSAPLPPKGAMPRPSVTLGLDPAGTLPRVNPSEQKVTVSTPAPKPVQQPVPMPTMPATAPLAELPIGEPDTPSPQVQVASPPPPVATPPQTPSQPPVGTPPPPPMEPKAPTPPVAPPPPKAATADPYREPIDEKDLKR